jgi:hypothetical protein
LAKRKELVVFYAWQSDSPDETNKTAIRGALKKAADELEKRYDGLAIVIDDATRGIVGSGNVPDSIRLKIEACDIFVGDVTTINPSAGPGDEDRRCPNPNVAFETGYAAANVGWDRMIIVTNTAFGQMSDLPFDFDRQRVSQYALTAAPNSKKRKALAALMSDALGAIIERDPKRPEDLRRINPAQVQRKRDVANIIWAISQVSLARLDSIIDQLPDHVGRYADYAYESFHAVVTSASFHIYDRKLSSAFRRLDEAWSKALSYGQHYFMASSGVYIFGTPGGILPNPDEGKDYRRIAAEAAKMRKQLDKLLKIIRGDYIEVDLDETDRIARERLKSVVDQEEAMFGRRGADEAGERSAEPGTD